MLGLSYTGVAAAGMNPGEAKDAKFQIARLW